MAPEGGGVKAKIAAMRGIVAPTVWEDGRGSIIKLPDIRTGWSPDGGNVVGTQPPPNESCIAGQIEAGHLPFGIYGRFWTDSSCVYA